MTQTDNTDGHPGEQSLELFVLDSDSLGGVDKAALTRHLEQCAGCRELAGRIAEFYRELESELGNIDGSLPIPSPDDLPLKVRQSMAYRRPDRPAIHEVETRLPFRVARWVTRHPVAATAGSVLAFGGLAAFLLWVRPGTDRPVEDVNPVQLDMRGLTMLVKNRSGQTVGSIPGDDGLAYEYANDRERFLADHRFIDVTGDGNAELLRVRRQTANNRSKYFVECHTFNPQEVLWVSEISRELDFPMRPDGNSPKYEVQRFEVGNYDGEGGPEALLLLSSGSFPSEILKLDGLTGDELSHSIHVGGLAEMQIQDLDGDSLKEIIVGGTNNSFNEAALVVIDPRRVRGQLLYTGDYALADPTPANERAYVRIPRTIVGRSDPTSRRSAVKEIIHNDRDNTLRVEIVDNPNRPSGPSDFYVTFNPDLSIKMIETGDGYNSYADSLVSVGLLRVKPDREYFESYKKQIFWWNGQAWVNRPAWNGNPGGPRASS